MITLNAAWLLIQHPKDATPLPQLEYFQSDSVINSTFVLPFTLTQILSSALLPHCDGEGQELFLGGMNREIWECVSKIYNPNKVIEGIKVMLTTHLNINFMFRWVEQTLMI